MINENEEIKCFIRFLKEKCLYRSFIKKFNDPIDGILFRKKVYNGIIKLSNVNIEYYLKHTKAENFIFDAFCWGLKFSWAYINEEWNRYYFNNYIKKRDE